MENMYYMTISGSTSTQTEKHMYSWMRENYDNCVIAEPCLDSMMMAVQDELTEFLHEHRNCKALSISYASYPDISFLHVGGVNIVIKPTKRVILP